MTQNSKKIAVTGGIGSGKSLVMSILREAGYPVFSCDQINAELWQEGEYLSELAQLFPQCVENGVPNKQKLAQTVFSDERALAQLNHFSHWKIMERLTLQMERYPLSFAEVPLLYEGGYEAHFDGVIALIRDREERVQAVVERDGLSREQISARMENQVSPESLLERDCTVVYNDCSAQELQKRILSAVEDWKKKLNIQ